MQNQAGNVCVRCGKPRVDVRTWKEYIKGILLTHTLTACPDPECQKKLDEMLAAQKRKQETAEEERAQRAIDNKLLRQSKAASLK